MISYNKTIVSFLLALALVLGMASAAETSSLRGADDVAPPDISGSSLEVEGGEPAGQRALAGAPWSAEYKYQERSCTCFIVCICGDWKDTDYRWCVDNSFTSSFPDTIGGDFLDTSPNNRLKKIGNVQSGTGCGSRNDIGDGSCSFNLSFQGVYGSWKC